ncbi:MAG: hypothetical protein ABIO94_05325 [Opitutaceae bacterium]
MKATRMKVGRGSSGTGVPPVFRNMGGTPMLPGAVNAGGFEHA